MQYPYTLEASAQLIARYHGAVDHWENGCYLRPIWLTPTQPALLCVQQHNQTLQVDVYADTEDEPLPTIQAKLAHMLCIHDDLTAFYRLANMSEAMQPIVEKLYGVHHYRSENIFEALVMVVIEQQISLYAALKAQRALVEWGGYTVQYEGRSFGVFPNISQLAEADAHELQLVLKITHRRVQLIQSIARQIMSGTLDLEALHHEATTTIHQRLMSLNGIGFWTASWMLIRGYGRYEIGGYNDVALRDAVSHTFYQTSERASVESVQDSFKLFAPYSGVAAFYTLSAWALEHY